MSHKMFLENVLFVKNLNVLALTHLYVHRFYYVFGCSGVADDFPVSIAVVTL